MAPTEPGGGSPQISPLMMPLGGESLMVVADAWPERFPNGLHVDVREPGALAPLSFVPVPRGCMLAIVPLGMSSQLREAIKREVAQRAQNPDPGKVAPPGFGG